MTTHTTPPARRIGLQDLPLPGHYGVLTWQLNVTLYPAIGELKHVSILREPVSQLELSREGGQGPWQAQRRVIGQEATIILGQMLYLAGWDWASRTD